MAFVVDAFVCTVAGWCWLSALLCTVRGTEPWYTRGTEQRKLAEPNPISSLLVAVAELVCALHGSRDAHGYYPRELCLVAVGSGAGAPL